MITARASIERLAPTLLGALRSRAAALDEPSHPKTRNGLYLRAPQDKFHPRRARRYGAKPFGHRAQPTLLACRSLGISKSRGSRSMYEPAPKAVSPRLGVHLIGIEWIIASSGLLFHASHFAVQSCEAAPLSNSNADRSAGFRPSFFNFVDQMGFQAQIDESALGFVVIDAAQGTVITGSPAGERNRPIGFHQGFVTESRKSSSSFSAQ